MGTNGSLLGEVTSARRSRSYAPGEAVDVEFERDGKGATVKITLGALPNKG